ncbi:polysaccharide biosynthesis tyrosine autokinase [Bradyrhizobium sp. B117]|uniref:polysaccharide biosynthesis tyrosine autokinase n=1 Tax=Bradyrhizobium sp. B117 TaxID=3140246 RepID=UPI0031832FD2
MTFHDIVATLKTLVIRQYPVMLITVAGVVALSAMYLLTAPRQYTSTANLIIDSRKINMLQQQSSPTADAPIESAMIDSQVEILKSETIALAVIKDLRLVDDPEFTGGSSGLISNLLGTVTGLFAGPSAPASDYSLTRQALQRFQSKLTVKRLGLSYVIEISFRSLSPERAARIANAVADAYIVDTLESKYQASRRAAVWLQDRLKELRSQASAAERAVADYKAQNNIVDAGGRLLSEQQLAEINSQLTGARAQRAEAEARLSRITNILEGDAKAEAGGNGSSLIDTLATVTDTLNNQVIIRLRQQYLDLAQREADWRNRYGANHLAVVNLRNQMREIKRSIGDELRRTAETFKSDAEIAKAREDSIEKSLSGAIAASNGNSQAQIVLRELESNAQSTRTLADNFLQLYMVSVQQQSFPITEARVITPASISLGPSSPKTNLILLGALVAGCILGGMIGFAREMLDRVVRTPSQLEALLKVSCLASIPVVSEKEARQFASTAGLTRLPSQGLKLLWPSRDPQPGKSGGHNPANGPSASKEIDVAETVLTAPFSRFAEAIRSIKLAADLNSLDTPSKVVGVTSSLPNEGKSTTSKALAYAFAKSGSRTLLVDADIRNPSITRQIQPDATAGLAEIVLGSASIEDVLVSGIEPNLDFIPSNVGDRFSNSADLLSSSQMERLFRELRNQYDRIIVDLSPLAPVIDVRGTGGLVDSYILLVEWARTKIDVVERALSETPIVQSRMLGAVLNKVDMSAMGRYDGHRGDYYYSRYYKRYGYTD